MSVPSVLISDVSIDAMDEAVFLAGRDATGLPQVESDLVGLQTALQLQLKPGGACNRHEVAAVLKRIKKTLWHVSLLVDYYDRVAIVQSLNKPSTLGADLLPISLRQAAPGSSVQESIGVSTNVEGLQSISSDAAPRDGALTTGEVVDMAGDHLVAPDTTLAPRLNDRPAAARSLSEIDREALLDALRLGPAADRRGPYTSAPRSKENSIYKLLVERFQVDPSASYTILEELVAEGSVMIRMRGLPPEGKTYPCIVVR